MAYNRNSLYVTIGGGLLNGTEHWSTGWHFANEPADTPSDLVLAGLSQVSITDIYAHAKTFIQTPGATGFSFPNYVSLEWAKVAAIGKDGKYLGDPKVYEQHNTGVGTSPTYAVPVQLAVCVSHWSGSQLGKANHGRAYLPLPSNFERVDMTTGLLNPTAVNLLRDQYVAMLKNIAGEASTVEFPNDPCLLSKLGTGTTKKIAQVGIGLVVDTMRSRRRSLADDVTNWVSPAWPD